MTDSDTNTHHQTTSSRLKGYLRILQVEEPLHFYPFDGDVLQESQTRLERRKKKNISNQNSYIQKSYVDLVSEHRFVCFFMVQGGGNFHYSPHTLTLRKTLALKFHNRMTIMVVFCGKDSGEASSLFAQGTGFASVPSSSTLMSILNITQVPSLVILDTKDGRPISSDAGLALEWYNRNDPQELLDAWVQQQSGLTPTQKVFSVLTLQSNCTIS